MSTVALKNRETLGAGTMNVDKGIIPIRDKTEALASAAREEYAMGIRPSLDIKNQNQNPKPLRNRNQSLKPVPWSVQFPTTQLETNILWVSLE